MPVKERVICGNVVGNEGLVPIRVRLRCTIANINDKVYVTQKYEILNINTVFEISCT